jgi:hypothetical protein
LLWTNAFVYFILMQARKNKCFRRLGANVVGQCLKWKSGWQWSMLCILLPCGKSQSANHSYKTFCCNKLGCLSSHPNIIEAHHYITQCSVKLAYGVTTHFRLWQVLASDKHSSLLQGAVNYDKKWFTIFQLNCQQLKAGSSRNNKTDQWQVS